VLFVTLAYFLFFFAVLVLFYGLSSFQYRKYLLLLASYFFYGSWNWKFLPLLWLLTLI